MNAILPAVALACLVIGHAGAQKLSVAPNLATIADARSWTLIHATAASVELDGRRAVRLTAEGDSANGIVGLALPSGVEFVTGTIDIDLKGRNLKQRSFLGVAFNVTDEKTFEAIYFRPFNFNAEEPIRRRSVQYIAWPVNTWEHLRKTTPGRFENSVTPVPDPDGWFHARIEVTAAQVRVFVNDANEPSLVTDRLLVGGNKRATGLFVDSAEGIYANFRITPNP